MNERLKPEDSREELINSLSGSYCNSHVMNKQQQQQKKLETGELIPVQNL